MTNRYSRAAARLVLIVCCLILPSPLVHAQNENDSVGFQTNHIFESGQFGENIDILNGGLNLSIPIGPRYQVSRYLGYQLQLSYGSKIWDHTPYPDVATQYGKLYGRNNMGLGFRMNFGRIYKDVERVSNTKASCVWYYVSPDGNEHALPAGESASEPCNQMPANGLTADRNYYQVEGFTTTFQTWNGVPSATNPAPVLRMYTPDNRLVYEFGHMIQVFTINNLPMNIAIMGTGYPDLQESDTDYNRDFGGWYVTKIYDYTSRDASNPYGRNYVSIEYDLDDPQGVPLPEYQSHTIYTSHAIKRITDSLHRQINFTNRCAPATPPATGCQQISIDHNDSSRISVRTTSISIPAFKNTTSIENPTSTTATYNFDYAWVQVNHVDPEAIQACNPSIGGDPNNCPQTSVNVLTEIDYPEFNNHSGHQSGANAYSMKFDYGLNAQIPTTPLLYGEIIARTLPTGAKIYYTWGPYYYLSGKTLQLTRKTLYMTPGGAISGDWFYTREAVLTGTAYTNPKYVTVKDPLGNETVYHYGASLPNPIPPAEGAVTNFEDGYAPEWNDGANLRIEYYEGNGARRKLIRTEDHEYDADPSQAFGSSVRTKDNVRETRVVTTYSDDGGTQAVVESSDWNDRGLWREKIESGDGIMGTRRTRTQYGGSGDASLFDYREVTDGSRVLSRTENVYDTSNRVTMTNERAALPATLGTGVNPQQSDPSDVVTVYTYDADSNVTQKDIGHPQSSASWQVTNPQYRIQYGYQPGGYLVTKQFYNFDAGSPGYFPWYAIYRERDGNTGLTYKTKDTAGVETNYVYDELGRVKDIQPSGSELATAVEYLSANKTAVRQGSGSTFACDQKGVAGDFLLTCYNYDALGRLVDTAKRPYDYNLCAPHQMITYDVLGRVTFQSEWVWLDDPNCVPRSPESRGSTFDYGDPATFGQPISRSADPFGRPRTVQTADGQITQTSYLGQSSIVTVKGMRNLSGGTSGTFDAITRYTRDVWGRLTEVLPPSGGGAKADYTYDLRDNLNEVDLTDPVSLAVQTRSFEYDALNRLRASVNPENGSEVITGYDVLGNVTAKTDSSGNHTFMTYDRAARLTLVTRQEYQKPGGSAPPVVTVLTNTYDMAGTTACPSTGADATFGYCDGKLTKTLSYDDLGNLLQTKQLYYQGLNGRVSQERNLFRGWKAAAGDILDTSILYGYNTFGQVSSTTYPEGPAGMGGALATTNIYSNGFLKETWDACHSGNPCVAGLLASATYNAAGGMQAIATEGSVSTNILPDSRNRPSKITIGKGTYDPNTDSYSNSTYYRSGAYAYDGAGNIYQIGSNLYGYDGANRLVQAKDIDPSSTLREQTFLYDAFGNMTEKTLRVNSAQTLTSDDVYTMTDGSGQTSNRIQQHTASGTAYTVNYDTRGNIGLADGRVFESDSRNRMVSVRALGSADRELARYAYDGSANRVSKDDRGHDLWTFYVRDLQGRLMSEFRMTQWGIYTPEWAKHYLYLGSRLVGMRDNQVPSPPSGLNATVSISGTTAYVTLSWRSNPAGEGATPSKYTVYRSVNLNAPEWTPITTVTSTSYVDTVAKGSSWKYLITAVVTKPGGVQYESYGSDTLIVRATATPPRPNAPTGLVTAPGDKRVFLTWNGMSATDLLGYHVYRRVGVQAAVRLTQIPIVQTSFLDQGYSNGQPLVNGTTYYYSISALNSSNLESTGNTEVSAIPKDYTPPGPPLGLKPTPACDGTGHVNLSWRLDVVADQATYLLYRLPQFASGASLPMGNVSTYTDASTGENQTYTYWVRATDANQNLSEESLHISVKTRAPSTVAAPARPFAESGDGKVSLRVAVPTGGPTIPTMGLYRKRNIDVACENYELVQTVARTTGSTDFIDGGVSNNLAYDYVVTNISTNGESGFSKPATAFPVQAPASYHECTQNLGVDWTNWKDGALKCGGLETNPLRRMLVRWEPPSAPFYQPLTADDNAGTLGYLLGYRVYRHTTPDPARTDYDPSVLVPLQVDYQKAFCQNHPDMPCNGNASCPSGDTCVGHSGSGYCDTNPVTSCTTDSQCGTLKSGVPGRCLGWSVGTCRYVPEVTCNEDSQCSGLATCYENYCTDTARSCFSDGPCDPTEKCVMNAAEDPYVTTYQDTGVNTFVTWPLSPHYAGSCLTATAVYRIFADGAWHLVESGYADNFTPSDPDYSTRCIQTTPDLCFVADDPQFACGPNGTLPPTPGTPAVTTQVEGQIKLAWEAPGACEPSPPTGCNIPPICPPGQYCDFSAPDGLTGFCKFNDTVFCSDSVSCPATLQGTVVACESRESEVAGYYIYVGEKNQKDYHFKPGSPAAWTDSATKEFTFTGLSRYVSGSTLNDFSFRIASFDRGGRISVLTPPPSVTSAQEPASAPATPASVKTVVWAGAGTTQASNAIRIKWLPGANYDLTTLTGYRVWRSTSTSGPYCALIKQTGPSGQLSWVCKDAGLVMAGDVTTSTKVVGTVRYAPKTSFIDEGVSQNVTYYYEVTVVTSSSQSVFSSPVTGLVLPRSAQTLSAPASFNAQAPNGAAINGVHQWTGINLKWCPNPAREGVTSYNVYRSQTSMGPYTASNLIANIPLVCLDGRHRCEIPASGPVTPSTNCQWINTGVAGNCTVVDTTVTQATANSPRTYYYVVTAVRTAEESGFSNENQGRPNCSNCDYDSTWHMEYDPDNSPEVICGDELAALHLEGPAVALAQDDDSAAPYRVIGQGYNGPTMPAGVPRFVYFHLNHLGSPIVETTASGGFISTHHYMPFGEEMPAYAQDTMNKRQFTGHERDDETGNDYMLARYYSSSLDRFMEVDPAGKSAKTERPQSWNRYAYVSNSPLVYSDPGGREQTVRVGDKYYMGGNDGIPAPTAPLVGKGSVAVVDRTVPMGNGNSMRVQVVYAEGESTAGGKLTGSVGVLKATLNTGQGGDTTGKVELKVFTADATVIVGSDGAKADARTSMVEVTSDLRTPDPDGQVCSFGGQVTVAGVGAGGGLDRTEGVEVSGETVPLIGGGIHGGPVKKERQDKPENQR